IFTYRLWEDVIDTLQNWTTVKNYTWDEVLVFEHKKVLNITEEGQVYYTSNNDGNGRVVWDGTNAYARRNE
ncbi:MAG: hypothetical protein Q4A54_06840, partial [Parabacteroides sp.]|nr:hypothetical protein [Parabacteroides sp.]